MAKKSTEATKVDTRQHSYLVFDEEKETKELLDNMFSKFNIMPDEVRDTNRKQDEILARITVLEDQVDVHDHNMDDLKQEVETIREHCNKDFDQEVTLVVTNPPRHANENPHVQSRQLETVGRQATMVKVLHTQQRENSKGVFKIQLGSKEEKVDILRHKSNLKDKGVFRNYIYSVLKDAYG